MSDTEDDSSISDSSWPVNETWLTGILTENHKCSEADIKILVSRCTALAISVIDCGFINKNFYFLTS